MNPPFPRSYRAVFFSTHCRPFAPQNPVFFKISFSSPALLAVRDGLFIPLLSLTPWEPAPLELVAWGGGLGTVGGGYVALDDKNPFKNPRARVLFNVLESCVSCRPPLLHRRRQRQPRNNLWSPALFPLRQLRTTFCGHLPGPSSFPESGVMTRFSDLSLSLPFFLPERLWMTAPPPPLFF